jgi:large subunit ribosomal protein L24
MKIQKGDTVRVMVGKDKGTEGKVEKVFVKQNKVLIPNVNMFKRHVKKTEQTPQGGIVDIPRPLDVSKVMLICPHTKKPTRVSYKFVDGKKVRFSKKANKAI